MSRGKKRALGGRDLVKVTVTLPPVLVEAADEVVLLRKRDNRAFNRAALIQEALSKFVREHPHE